MDSGTLIAARYRLDHRLAAGGMGTVWAAHDELLGRDIALKVLHPALAADEGFRRRFRAEARAAAKLSHPGVVGVYDFGEDAELTFLAMELVRGESLRQVLARRGPLPPDEALRILRQAADALAEAHAHGLVHRDVKPANLLVTANGSVKVTDFGIARTPDMTTATGEGSVLGTVAYMSPEQVRGERVGAASDVYSLGVVAYESLAGVRPFPAEDSIAVALSHVRDPAPPLPDSVPPAAAALVASMLRKEPATRPSIRRVAERAAGHTASAPGAVETVGLVDTVTASSLLSDAEITRPHAAAPALGPSATFRTLGAALGAAAVKARGRDARRRAAAGVVGAVVLGALVIGTVLAAAVPGAAPHGRVGRTPAAASRHTATQPAVDRHLASTTSGATAAITSSTSSTSSTTTSTTAPAPSSTHPTGPAAPGPAAPGGAGPGGPGGPGHSPTAPGHGGPGHNGPGQDGPGPGAS